MQVPEKNEFPGTGPAGNGISPNVKSQAQWLRLLKTDGCEACHQLGNKDTRTIPGTSARFDSPVSAWERRVQSGPGRRQHDRRPRSARQAARA